MDGESVIFSESGDGSGPLRNLLSQESKVGIKFSESDFFRV